MNTSKNWNKHEPVKVVILAAGSGRRLQMDLPKAMVHLKGGRTVLDHQLENLKQFFHIDEILLVVGYKKEIIMERFPDLIYTYNRAYDVTNTSKSLLLALRKLRGCHVLWLNGDVIFDPVILQEILKGGEENRICVNREKVGPEEIKYRLDEVGRIAQLSKEVEEAEGEAVGINFLRRENLEIMIRKLQSCEDGDYFEKGVLKAIREDSISFLPLEVGSRFCMEVDFPEDLQKAKDYIAGLS